ncbi:hypothetical protein CYY_007891 [Polysphondylium violaceum]|uniref:Uncharacterized protein n=1 Tax=Polysphondylium violaceum TaxID=133409 RepID=A0A8J4UXD9_9MYCE|nr:hypothetical protein CYY_007891 [Polysphondylium violaceum]
MARISRLDFGSSKHNIQTPLQKYKFLVRKASIIKARIRTFEKKYQMSVDTITDAHGNQISLEFNFFYDYIKNHENDSELNQKIKEYLVYNLLDLYEKSFLENIRTGITYESKIQGWANLISNRNMKNQLSFKLKIDSLEKNLFKVKKEQIEIYKVLFFNQEYKNRRLVNLKSFRNFKK